MQPLRDVPLQSQLFYNGFWSPKVDGMLVATMLRFKEEVGWIGDDFPTSLMPIVSRELHDKCGFAFTKTSLVIWLYFLSARRRSFKAVIASKGTYWRKAENFVYAVEPVWVAMMEKDPFATSYYYHGEPEYDRLCDLFGSEENNEPPPPSVIEISSSEDGMASYEGDVEPMEVDVDEDEVNSPALPTQRCVRRKLFPGDDVNPAEIASERASCSEREIHNPKKSAESVALEGIKNLSPFGSSCASNSPHSQEFEAAKCGNRK